MLINRILHILILVCTLPLLKNSYGIEAQDKETALKTEINRENKNGERSFNTESESVTKHQEENEHEDDVLRDGFYQENPEFELIDITDEVDQSPNFDYQTGNGFGSDKIGINYRIWIVSHYIELISNDIFHFSSIFNNEKYDNETVFVSFYSDA